MNWIISKIKGYYRKRNTPSASPAADTQLTEVTCPICACVYYIDASINSREGKLCPDCGASGRSSAIVYYVCRIIHGNTKPLCHQPKNKGFKIVGLSDGPVYAKLLAQKYDYVNTFYHREPFLDIMNPNHDIYEKYDLLISTEVFEHVIGLSIQAFKGAISILRPGGYMILTVPFINDGESQEHYPGIRGYTSRKVEDERWVADIEFQDGSKITDYNAKFHGGPGHTLEVRLFNRQRLLTELADAGFVDVVIHDENLPQHGINWSAASRVITARKPL